MSESNSDLQRKIVSATDLKSVVRTMKAMAAANINQYENAVLSLDDYYRTVQLGLTAYFINTDKSDYPTTDRISKSAAHKSQIGIIVIGSDQGLVGQFNDILVNFLNEKRKDFAATQVILTAGERVRSLLEGEKALLGRHFSLPNSIDSITSFVAEILLEVEELQTNKHLKEVYLFFNRTLDKPNYGPCYQRILPFDHAWKHEFVSRPWPTRCLPQLLVEPATTVSKLIREYIFTSIFRGCIESLASENASRLIAMQRAEKNIEELQEQMQKSFNKLRQSAIDEELADLVNGFEALSSPEKIKTQ
ncbi:F0F1 ATP synthase subunit gamma [Aliiglaciecola sp. 3_MG-2023]|uniref:F0F1 ATP synthase subunit gamma n=1 Tax=Aliiglaciecola sp. 3_MG-2023 TaxID=3062644 RepID=UPI0026E280D1|nr:F0F1 ATP synthase subunit gamma [Aliiglaciecola sp. 3_MG-2023]MDO6693537.1 F0F1 ATP synthase subunit gamma [Aliiglaciecola sp. 3_MG-2023]